MANRDRANVNLDITSETLTWENVTIALLMDIRAELQTLNAVFRCHNALVIPNLLREIKVNTAPLRQKKRK